MNEPTKLHGEEISDIEARAMAALGQREAAQRLAYGARAAQDVLRLVEHLRATGDTLTSVARAVCTLLGERLTAEVDRRTQAGDGAIVRTHIECKSLAVHLVGDGVIVDVRMELTKP